MANKVTCINKVDRDSAYERITHIGGVTDKEGNKFHITQQTAIEQINSGKYSFYTEINGDRAEIIVSSRNGREYIKTENDGDEPNNLLSLPQCIR